VAPAIRQPHVIQFRRGLALVAEDCQRRALIIFVIPRFELQNKELSLAGRIRQPSSSLFELASNIESCKEKTIGIE
jgi:hypothetical protein